MDVFFVISGFLISTLIFENLDKGTFSFSEFYARRVKRIFPALLLVLITSYVIGWFVLLIDEYKQLGKHIAAGVGFASNFVLWSEAGYFDNATEKKPLLHLWSLGIEEQFYVVWPVVLWLAWKAKFNLLTLTIVVSAISFALNLKGVKHDAIATFYSPQTRIWELLCGSTLAWFALYKKDAYGKARLKIDGLLSRIIFREKFEADGRILSNMISLSGLLLLVYGFLCIGKELAFPGKWATIPVLGAVLVISSGPKAWFNRKVLSNKIAVWFGLISFPLYLWHWPLLSFARIVEDETPSRSIRIAVIVLSILLAWLTYKLVERPLRLGKHGKAKVTVLLLLMIVIGCLGYNTYKRDGLSFRLKNLQTLNEIISNPLPVVQDIDCGNKIPELSNSVFDGGCRLSKDEPPTIVFVGDSHTAHYRNAVWNSFSSKSVLMVVATSCLPFSSSSFLSGECRNKYTSIIKYLEDSRSVETVVLSGYWAYLIAGSFGEEGENWRKARTPTDENIKTFKANAIEFISRILKSGKSVVLLKDIPDLDFNIRSCFNNRPFRISTPLIREDCSISEEAFLARVKPFDAAIDEILRTFPEVKTYDPRPLFCSGGRCYGSDGKLPYYWNGDHVNRFGAQRVIDGLLNELHLKRD